MANEEIQSKLIGLYSTVPNYVKILEGVERGETEYLKKLEEFDLLSRHSKHISKVHTYDDVRVQAFILSIPTDGDLDEMTVKSLLTFGTHFIDDFLDRPDLEPGLENLVKNRHNIEKLLGSMGNVGRFSHFLARRARHPEGVYRGLQLMAYAALSHLAETKQEQELYLEENKQFGLQEIPESLKRHLNNMRPLLYWLTKKTAQEIWIACEPRYDSAIAELWNLIYSPALYFHDADEEKKKGELNFLINKHPTIEEMVSMINIATNQIRNFDDVRAQQRLQQLSFLRKAFQRILPTEISQAYDRLERQLL